MKNKHSLFSNFIFTYKYIWKNCKSLLALMLVMIITNGISEILYAFGTKIVISDAQMSVGKQAFIIHMLSFCAGIIILQWLRIFSEKISPWRISYVAAIVRKERMKKTMVMDYDLLEQTAYQDLQKRAIQAEESETAGVSGIIKNSYLFLTEIVRAVFACSIIVVLNIWWIVMFLVVSVVLLLIQQKTKEYDTHEVWEKMAPMWRKLSYVQSTASDFSYAKDIRIFKMKKWILKKYDDTNSVASSYIGNSLRNWNRYELVNNFLMFISKLSFDIWLVYNIYHNKIDIASFFVYREAVEQFFKGTLSIATHITELYKNSREIDDLRSFLEIPDCTQNGSSLPLPKKGDWTIKFDNVSFRYNGQERYALKNVTFEIRSGRKFAIVGINGAGKTTIVKLLLRLYQPTEGHILLNGVDINEYDRYEYYSMVAAVFQNVELFALPLYANVSMTMDCDEEKFNQCMKNVDLLDKVKSLPKGKDTQMLRILHEDGIELSGGEKQRISMARAMYRDSRIVVFDEPTAALDPIAEKKQYETFDRLVGIKKAVIYDDDSEMERVVRLTDSKTSIYISHRLASTRFCDSIAMFDNGQLIELGSHEQLMKGNGRYAEMYNVQAKYYAEE